MWWLTVWKAVFYPQAGFHFAQQFYLNFTLWAFNCCRNWSAPLPLYALYYMHLFNIWSKWFAVELNPDKSELFIGRNANYRVCNKLSWNASKSDPLFCFVFWFFGFFFNPISYLFNHCCCWCPFLFFSLFASLLPLSLPACCPELLSAQEQ